MSILKSLPSTIRMLDINSSCCDLAYRPKQLLFFFSTYTFRYIEPNNEMNLNQSRMPSGLHTEVTGVIFGSLKVAVIIHCWRSVFACSL